MNIEDADIVNAERDADPERWHDYNYAPIEAARASRTRTIQNEAAEEAERVGSVSSSSTGSSIRTGTRNQSHRPSVATRTSTKLETEFMHYLDRHPTAVKRMQDREWRTTRAHYFILLISNRSSSAFTDSWEYQICDGRWQTVTCVRR